MTSFPLVLYCVLLCLVDVLLVNSGRPWIRNFIITTLVSVVGCAVFQTLNAVVTGAISPFVLVAGSVQIALGVAIGAAVVIATHHRH